MPKRPIATEKLRQARIKDKIALSQKNLPTAEIYLCVLGNGGIGSPSSLYIFTDHVRYLFNCGEGTQRLAHEYKMKLSKLNHIFITHNSWKNVGGILGLSLTVQDIGVPQIKLHGPPNIENIYNCSKSFIMLKNLVIDRQLHDVDSFSDDCLKIQNILIFSSSSVSNGSEDGSKHGNKKPKLCEETSADAIMAFICKGHSKPGHLDFEKCVEQGVPKGPLLGKLKNGQDVVLPSGKIVYSCDVLSQEEECPVFIVVECPSETFIDSLLNEQKFRAYQLNGSESPAALVVHFTPSFIIQNVKYQKWMKMFPETTCHLCLNENCSSLNSVSIHRIQYMLNLIHPNVFRLLYETEDKSVFMNNYSNIVLAKSQDRFYLRPFKGLERKFAVDVDSDAFIKEAMSAPGFPESLQEFQNNVKAIMLSSENVSRYPEILFLGTGSSIPNKVRNVSSILVNINKNCSIFLDCGEGTYSQLVKNYNQEITRSILMKISCIFISHLHADHHLGLFTLLTERKNAFRLSKKDYLPVIVIAPHFINSWLNEYDICFSSLFRFIECNDLHFKENILNKSEQKSISKIFKITTVPVVHCPGAYGAIIRLISNSNWTLVYSGDTTPCQALVDAGAGCDLLIHEATMEDDLADEAALKMHSTTSQAIEIAEQMAAKYTILTHFSQRYAKVPLIDEELHNHIGFAFDNMKVCVSDLPIIPLFIPSLQKLFAEHVKNLQERGKKRKTKV